MDLWERRKRDILICDGAMGTLLLSRGLPRGMSPSLWNLTRPEEVWRAHYDYVAAGCDILFTNTFGANRARLTGSGAEKTQAINRAAVEIARAAAGDDLLVAGDVGPIGEKIPASEAAAIFAEQIRDLAPGCDLLCIETMTSLAEAEAALQAAREEASDLPLMLLCVFGSQVLLGDGASFEEVARAAERWRVEILGSNCGVAPGHVVEALRGLAAQTRVALAAKPSAGLPEERDGRLRYPIGPEEFAEWGRRCVEAGARLVGGCCGTTPAHIRALAQMLRKPEVS